MINLPGMSVTDEQDVYSILAVGGSLDSQRHSYRVLEQAGHRVAMFELGGEAVRAAEENRYDLIVMDVVLPDMTGFDASRSIRTDERLMGRSQTPIIGLAAHASQDDRDHALGAGMNDYFQGPLTPKALLEVIRRCGSPASPRRTEADRYVPFAALRPIGGDLEEIVVSKAIAHLLPAYIARVAEMVVEIEKHLQEDCFDAVFILGHNLKGTGGTYGFDTLSNFGRQIELAAQAENVVQVKALADDLVAWLNRIRWTVAG